MNPHEQQRSAAFFTVFHTIPQGGSFRTIDPLTTCPRHYPGMARYSAFLGRRVEVHYRAGDILLPASGIFVADSGRSIFLEQSISQRGQQKHFRWEIPYQYIVRLQEKVEDESGGSANAKASAINTELKDQVSSAAASASGGAPALLPLRNRPKTA
jgi:hypothetical protein